MPKDPVIPLRGIGKNETKKPELKETHVPQCSLQYCLQCQDMEVTQMSIGRWMDKEIVVYIHNGILLNYKKKYIWVSSNEVDETGAHTEWSKSEREIPILYINAYIWNLERQ